MVIQRRTVDHNICAIEDLECVTDQANLFSPVVHSISPIVVSLIVRVSAEARSNVEETSLRDGVLVVPAFVDWTIYC